MDKHDEILTYRALIHRLNSKLVVITVGDTENCKLYFKELDRLNCKLSKVMGWK